MNLRTRLALTLTALVAFASIAVAVAGYRVTSGRLSREVEDSLNVSAAEFLERGGYAAAEFCGVASRRQRPGPPNKRDDRRSRGVSRIPSSLSVQCLSTDGTVLAASPTDLLPVEPADIAVASGAEASPLLRDVQVEGEKLRVRTERVEGVGALQIARSLEETDRIRASLLRRFSVLALGVVALAALAGLALAKRISRPVTQLTGAAERIARTGEFDHSIDAAAAGSDEIGRLAQSFVTMVDALRTTKEQQARLVQDAGHELRTPLTSIRTNVSLLRRPDLPAEKRAAILDSLNDELVELTDLTNELVALAGQAIDSDPFERVSLVEVANHAVERCRRRTGRTITVRVASDDGAPVDSTASSSDVFVDGQPAAISRCIDNLLGNATKFAPPSTPIDLTVTQRPGAGPVLQVRDHGPGIEPADLPHVFDRFFRSTAARTLPGSGLGLSIVKDTMDRHRGTVIASNAPDGGAVFELRFPSMPSEGTHG